MKRKAEDVDIMNKKTKIEIGVKQIINALLSNSSNVITGIGVIEHLVIESKYNPDTHVMNIHVFTKNSKATLVQCKMLHHISPDLSVSWKNTDDGCVVSVFLKDEELTVYIHPYDEKEKYYASHDDGFCTNFVELSKLGTRVKDIKGAFSAINSSNIIEHILYHYEKGYVPIVAPLVSANIEKRMLIYAHCYSEGKGWTPIRWENSDNAYEATIGTTLEAIENFHPDIYKNRVKDNKCPISQIPFSDMKEELVVLTNTDYVYQKKAFLDMIKHKDFNFKCPSTKLDLN